MARQRPWTTFVLLGACLMAYAVLGWYGVIVVALAATWFRTRRRFRRLP